MSFYECVISKQTQWCGNKICISNIFGAVISYIFFLSHGQSRALHKKKIVSKFKKATGQWTPGWLIKFSVKCPGVYNIELHNIWTLASFIFFHFQQRHIIENNFRNDLQSSFTLGFSGKGPHMKRFPISITSAGDLCLGKSADMSPIARGASSLLSPLRLPN